MLGYAPFLIMSMGRLPCNVALFLCTDAQNSRLFVCFKYLGEEIFHLRTFFLKSNFSILTFLNIPLSRKLTPLSRIYFTTTLLLHNKSLIFCRTEKLHVKPARSCKLRPFLSFQSEQIRCFTLEIVFCNVLKMSFIVSLYIFRFCVK